MATCSYCREPASAEIPATPGHVCVTHAIEFWSAFLRFAQTLRVEQTERERLEAEVQRPAQRMVRTRATGKERPKSNGRPATRRAARAHLAGATATDRSRPHRRAPADRLGA